MNRQQRRAGAKLGQTSGKPAREPGGAFLAEGVKHHQAGRFSQAEASYRRALATQPDNPDVLHLLGLLAHQQGRHDAAVELIGQAIKHNPVNPAYYFLLGSALKSQGRFDEAVAACRQTIRLGPNYAEPYVSLGAVLHDQGKLDEAADAFRRAIALKPDYNEAHFNLGVASSDLGRLNEALAAFRRAIEIKPADADSYTNLGVVLNDLGRLDEALAACRRAIEIDPDSAVARCNLLLCLNYDDRASAQSLFAEHRDFGARMGRQAGRPLAQARNRETGRRLRIGYVSPDLRAHSVAQFFEPLLREHDRQAVEIFCYAEVLQADAVTARLRELSDSWLTTVGLSDEALAQRIRADGVDILVDLAGHTRKNRLGVFARKPAPVQATWLGYPNTTGLDAIDYRLVDATTDPVGEADAWASETLLRLAGGFLCYGGPKDAGEPAAPPCLTTGVVTFGSFNNPAKLSASTLDAWARMLIRLPQARLLLKGKPFADPSARALLLGRLGERGVAAERVELAGRIPNSEAHLALYDRIDIALDPFPYNGATTTCEALWMGVPVVTLSGDRHAARVGASLLGQIGLTDLVAHSVEDYVERAVALAGDPPRLDDLRRTLRPRMAASPLCDGPAFARKIEDAFRQMWLESADASL